MAAICARVTSGAACACARACASCVGCVDGMTVSWVTVGVEVRVEVEDA
jgi:hypothetical protein